MSTTHSKVITRYNDTPVLDLPISYVMSLITREYDTSNAVSWLKTAYMVVVIKLYGPCKASNFFERMGIYQQLDAFPNG